MGFAGAVEALSAACAPDWPVVAVAGALSPVAPVAAALEELELELAEFETAVGADVSAGGFAVPEPLRPASTVPWVAGGATAGAGAFAFAAGVVAAGCSEVGWPLSSSGVMI